MKLTHAPGPDDSNSHDTLRLNLEMNYMEKTQLTKKYPRWRHPGFSVTSTMVVG
jgi:hypothetical protein